MNRKLGNQSKPLVTISAVDDKTISFKQESLVKTSEFSCQVGVPFDETTADGRKVTKPININSYQNSRLTKVFQKGKLHNFEQLLKL